MRTETITIYDQEDFDAVKKNMDIEQAITILTGLPRGWFPYRLPLLGETASESDFDNWKICCAIRFVIEKLEEAK